MIKFLSNRLSKRLYTFKTFTTTNSRPERDPDIKKRSAILGILTVSVVLVMYRTLNPPKRTHDPKQDNFVRNPIPPPKNLDQVQKKEEKELITVAPTQVHQQSDTLKK